MKACYQFDNRKYAYSPHSDIVIIMNNAKLIQAFREADIVSHEPVTLRAGEVSPYYVDVKKAYGDPRLLKMAAEAIAYTLNPQAQFVAASGYGGIPLGAAVSLETGLPFSMVRDTEKNHGKQGFIDGYVPAPGEKGAVVDDVFTTGDSLRTTTEILNGREIEVIYYGVIVARGDTSRFGSIVTHLLTPADLV